VIQLTAATRILVAVDSVDFRAGIDALAQQCRARLRVDPYGGTLIVFGNRRRTAIKILTYDGQGFWLATKRLSRGRFPHWPVGGTLQALAAHQLQVLLMGGDPYQARGAPEWRPLPRAA
jgi:transposase